MLLGGFVILKKLITALGITGQFICMPGLHKIYRHENFKVDMKDKDNALKATIMGYEEV
jgi:hypothetical protein